MILRNIAAVLIAAAVLTACGGSPTNTPAATVTVTQTAASEPVTPPSTTSSTTTTESTLTKNFGSTFTWPDGIAVTVSKPAPYTPSSSAAKQTGDKKFISVETTLKNGTKAPIEASQFYAKATTGDREAHEVFDSGQGMGGSPSSTILPGKELKWKTAWGVEEGKPFVMTVSYSFDRSPGIYQEG
jgi:hypothetical protein